MHQLFFIEGKLLGEAPRLLIRTDRDVWGAPLSRLFFCARCGEVFARCPVLKDDGEHSLWSPVYALCRRCAPLGNLIPGSIWFYEEPFVAAFPDAVLRWELERHLDYHERFSK